MSMAYVNCSRFKKYHKMTDNELKELVLSFNVSKIKDLQKLDSVLVKVIRLRRITNALNLHEKPRKETYGAMPDDALILLAQQMSLNNDYKLLTDFWKNDCVLYKVLCSRKLTGRVAEICGFQFTHRTGVIKTQKAVPSRAAKPVLVTISKQEFYSSLNDDDFYFQVIKSDTRGSSELQRNDSALYVELSRRFLVRQRLSEEYGWRRPPREWSVMTMADWLSLAEQFDSARKFNELYGAAVTHARKQGVWDTIVNTMSHHGLWIGCVGSDGMKYASSSELIVANLLWFNTVDYRPHPILPFQSSRRRREGDFLICDSNWHVEVFAFSKHGRQSGLSWQKSYLDKRDAKIKGYKNAGLRLIAIEATIWREKGFQAYLEHIQIQFAQAGIELAKATELALTTNMIARGMTWTVAEFVDYACANGIENLDGFFKCNHRDLYTALRRRRLRDSVRKALDDRHGRRSKAMGSLLLPIDEIRQICRDRGIESKKEYQEAHRSGSLPEGFPSSVRESFDVNFTKFFKGRERSEFMPFDDARKIVRACKFNSRKEFQKAVLAEDPTMAGIRRCPSNQINGGYKEWINWDDWLGKS